MSFWKQFKPKSCSVNLKAADKAGVITEVVENLVKSGMLDSVKPTGSTTLRTKGAVSLARLEAPATRKS